MHHHLNHDKNLLISIVIIDLFPFYLIQQFSLDPHDRLFEQENNAFFTTNTDQQGTTGPVRQRITSMFGDINPEGRFYEPQKITDDALMDVCIYFSQKIRNNIFLIYSSRLNIMIH